MAKTYTQIISNFSKGMTNDVRTDDTHYSQLIKNFDAHSYSRKLVPYVSSASGATAPNTKKIQNFAVALQSANAYKLYGLGVSGTKAQVFVNNSLNSATWNTMTKGTASSHTSVDFELFIYYANTGRIYGAADGTTIWAIDPADSAAFDESDGSDEYAHTLATAYANPRSAAASNRPYISGMVHSKDDILYVGYDNIIISNNGSTWTDPALTLPSKVVITSLCEYGNYLAIAVKSKDGVGGSQVYLWDRDATLSTISEKLDFGEGNLQVLEEVGGVLVGISTTGTAATARLTRVTFRYYAGGKPVVFNQFVSEEVYVLSDLPRAKRKVNDYLHFFMVIKLGGTTLEGIWKVGKHIQTGEMVVSLAYPPNNDTALSSGELHSFIIVGDGVYISYTTSAAIAMNWIDAIGSTYTASSIWETTMLGGKDISTTKKLVGVTPIFEPLVTAGTVTVKYKADEETSWTTIIDAFGTDNAVKHSAINIESSGLTLPTFNEIQFQVISKGQAIPTGLKFKYSEIPDDIYG